MYHFHREINLFLSFLLLMACDIGSKKPQDSDNLKQLQTLPYLQGTYKARKDTNVTIKQKETVHNGLNVYNSAHDSAAYLVNMEGKVVHKWTYAFDKAFPDVPEDLDIWYNQKHWRKSWRRIHLYDNGDLLAIWEGNGLIKLDKDSRLLWARKDMFHHDIEVTSNGNIYVLNRRLKTFPDFNNNKPILEDLITILDPEGNLLETHSIVKMLLNSDYTELINHVPQIGDCFHTNTIEVLDGKFTNKSGIFKNGNILLSMRMFDTIAIADIKSEKIVWAERPGFWKKQHHPTLLNNGNMLLFNNIYAEKGKDGYDASSVIEFEPLSMKIHWEYKGTKKIRFFSEHSGSNQRLSNGNTIIAESAPGIAFEVDPTGKKVWEFVNPNRTGPKNQYTPTLYELIRIEPERSKRLKWVNLNSKTSETG